VDFIDYIVTDRMVTPPDQAQFFTEKFVYLPHSYQVNDSEQPIAEDTPTRADCGLPQDAFVFCCFNNNYKIEPVMFDVWMRILSRVPGSGLWLLSSSPEPDLSLRREAEARGVAGDRLIFAARQPKTRHLARHRVADLFLDTLYYNAHTTASDALWAGLPLLTCPGRTFASRVGASLLAAIGLPELITPSLEAYERLAVRLATHPGELRRVREKLQANRLSAPLFDTARFARGLEQAYHAMWDIYQSGAQPRQIEVREPQS
jgi:predicted O-linked N-acetylglucosamine transferase (SPINDLY family)